MPKHYMCGYSGLETSKELLQKPAWAKKDTFHPEKTQSASELSNSWEHGDLPVLLDYILSHVS